MSTPILAMIPSGVKAAKLYSVLPTDGTGDFTVARAGLKHKVNSDLNLELIAATVPSLNYDAIGGCPVLNTEPLATNLIKYPISFGNSYWTKSGATIEGDASTAGSELVTNGSFATDTDWTKDSGWTISGGKANYDGVIFIASIQQPISFVVGKLYKYTFTISSLTQGGVRVFIGNTVGATHSSNGTFTGYITYASGNNLILQARDSFIGSIDNVSVKEVQGYSSPSVDFPTSAFKLVEDTSTGGHNINKSITVTAGSNAISIRAKAGERNWILLRDTQSNTGRYFDLTNGVIGSVQGTTPLSSTIKPLADGWYDVSITLTAPATTTSAYVYVTNADATLSHTGDGTSGVYIFMAQVETGKAATSPTFTDITLAAEGSISTRLADVVNGAGDVNTFNSSEGVLFSEFEVNDYTSTNYYQWGISNLLDKEIVIGSRVGKCFTQIYDGTTAVNENATPLIIGVNKVAIKWVSSISASVYLNGSLIHTYIGTIPTLVNGDLTKAHQGDRLGGGLFYGNTKQLQYFNTALTDAELQALTTL